jgi:mannose-6-phosphate isomerase-like protein (cupin superfamily)
VQAGQVVTVVDALASSSNGTAPTVSGADLEQHALVLPPGTMLHRSADRAETLFVLSGTGRVRIGAEEHELAPETGFYLAAGEEAELEADEELRLVRALAPAGEQDGSRAVAFADASEEEAGIGRHFRLLACSSTTTQFVGIVPPGRAKMHNHPYDEVACVLEGQGVLHWEDDTHVPVGPGSCIYFPRLVLHSLENTGSSNLRIMGVINPKHSPAERVDVLDW